jgi:hypothetical protein
MNRRSLLTNTFALMLGVLFVLVATAVTAFGQAGTSTVRGLVKDPQGNLVAGATVTITNAGTSFSRTTTTTNEGLYSFEQVPVGDYRLEVTATGFKKAVVTDVHALVSKITPADVTLEIGNVSETVTVSSGAAENLINRDDGSLGNNFVNKQITQLPLEARSPLALLTLQPGVTREGYVAGARTDQSNVTLDGVDINDAQTNAIVGTDGPTQVPNGGAQLTAAQNHPVIRLNAEAIEEFRVTTVNANANQGRSSGAQISLVTKSGSNDWHGALFEANRNTTLTANDFYNNSSGIGRPKLIRNTFGGAVGGPIIKNRFFFFYSYEERKDISETPAPSRPVPLASLGQGLVRFKNPSGGIITITTAQLNTIFPAGMNPVAIAALRDAAAKYPANDPNTGDGLNTGGFLFNAKTPVTLHSHAGRFDYNINSKQVLFLRANIIYDLTGGIPQFPDTPAPNLWEHPMGFVVGHNWTISSRFVNNFHYGLTREAFSQQGDSGDNQIIFRFVFAPRLNPAVRTLNRTTPVHNITDDFSWLKGNHAMQFGGNVRLISNKRSSFANAFDNAITNPSFYFAGGNSLSDAVSTFSVATFGLGNGVDGSFTDSVQAAVTALAGRFSQYTANFTFDHDGKPLPAGSPTNRDWKTREYDVYGQDVWKIRPNLTLTYGLRYSYSTPIWEANGFETGTNIPLSDFFAMRLAGAQAGKPFNDPISVELTGRKNGKRPLYDPDKNNFQPRVAIAWSPGFERGLLGKFFGAHRESVLRGGFGITNDYYGQQLAVTFDLNNALGFSSSQNINANTFSLPDIYGGGGPRPLAPLFTGYGVNIRALPNITTPATLTFPQTAPFTTARPIQSSLDQRLIAPINYSWNFTFERSLPHGLVLQASYVGRAARHLIAARDVMALNDLVDPQSGMDWYTAAGMLEQSRVAGIPVSAIPSIAYFQNIFPANLADLINTNYCGGVCIDPTLNQTQAVYAMAQRNFFGNDWTDTQDALDQAVNGGISGPNNLFFQPQYGALSAYSSIAKSNYHAGTLSIRERLGSTLTMDFNYTLSHSLDDASGLATAGAFGGAFILNPIRQRDSYANSDFDIRHIVNMNAVWTLPFGRGRTLFGDANKVVNGIIGGWQLSGIFRWNSGLPVGFYGDSGTFDNSRWATNWNVQSNTVRIRPIQTCPDRGGPAGAPPKLFGCNTQEAFDSFRNARPGESGDRNVFRVPGYVDLDIGLGKSFTMPWSEKHKLQVRAEAFNITNTQRLGQYSTGRSGFGINLKPSTAKPPPAWSNFIRPIQGSPRVLQLGFRYEF